MFDHYPFCGPWSDAESDDLIADICAILDARHAAMSVPTPVGAPALPPTRFVKFGDAMICTTCTLDSRYCKCAMRPAPDAQSKDAAQAAESLARRIKDCQAR